MVVLRSADIKAIAKQVAEELAGMNDSLLNISKVAEMSKAQIEEKAQLTGWEPSDAELLEDGE